MSNYIGTLSTAIIYQLMYTVSNPTPVQAVPAQRQRLEILGQSCQGKLQHLNLIFVKKQRQAGYMINTEQYLWLHLQAEGVAPSGSRVFHSLLSLRPSSEPVLHEAGLECSLEWSALDA